jgi:hypothetical protein
MTKIVSFLIHIFPFDKKCYFYNWHLFPAKRISDDDVYLEYYSRKGFHINYSCLHVLRKTHKLVQ